MTVLVDTNILLYAVNSDAPQHDKARDFIERLRSESGFCVAWCILYEWLRVVTHPRVLPRPLEPARARDFITRLISDARVDILRETPRHASVLAQLLEESSPLRGNLYHDAHIAALMLENGISRIATADRLFSLFRRVEVIDPTV